MISNLVEKKFMWTEALRQFGKIIKKVLAAFQETGQWSNPWRSIIASCVHFKLLQNGKFDSKFQKIGTDSIA